MSIGRNGDIQLTVDERNSEFERLLGVSTGGFLVFSSVLFLLERLGAPVSVITWSLIAGIAAIAFFTGFSGRTTHASGFFVAFRGDRAAALVTAGAFDSFSTPLFFVLVTFPAGGSLSLLMIMIAIIAGIGLNGWLFATQLRKSGAYTIADFLGFRFNSKSIRFCAMAVVAVICVGLLYAEIQLAGLILEPIFSFSNTWLTGSILFLATLAGLFGGAGSVSRMQGALLLLVMVVILTTGAWLAASLVEIPLPQMLLFQIESLAAPTSDEFLLAEITPALAAFDLSSWLAFFGLMFGILSLPYITNRSFSALSVKGVKQSRLRSIILIILLLSSVPALKYTAFFGGEPSALTAEYGLMPVVLSVFVPLAVFIVAVSTASILLITIANTLAHDGYRVLLDGNVPPTRQVFISRFFLILSSAGIWFYGSNADIPALLMFMWALVLATGGLLPSMIMAAIWKKSSRTATLVGMVVGILIVAGSFLTLETTFGRKLILENFNLNLIDLGLANGALAPLTAIITLVLALLSIYLVSLTSKPDEITAQQFDALQDPEGEYLIQSNL